MPHQIRASGCLPQVGSSRPPGLFALGSLQQVGVAPRSYRHRPSARLGLGRKAFLRVVYPQVPAAAVTSRAVRTRSRAARRPSASPAGCTAPSPALPARGISRSPSSVDPRARNAVPAPAAAHFFLAGWRNSSAFRGTSPGTSWPLPAGCEWLSRTQRLARPLAGGGGQAPLQLAAPIGGELTRQRVRLDEESAGAATRWQCSPAGLFASPRASGPRREIASSMLPYLGFGWSSIAFLTSSASLSVSNGRYYLGTSFVATMIRKLSSVKFWTGPVSLFRPVRPSFLLPRRSTAPGTIA